MNQAPPFPIREAHAHIAAHARELTMLNLSECSNRGEALERVRAEASGMVKSRPGSSRGPGWLVASGLRPEGWADPRWITRQELDAACPDRPAFVMSFDHHSGCVNRRAFEASGFSEASADPAGGVIVRDQHGTPTGLLLEEAFNIARRAIPEPTTEEWVEIVARGAADLAAHGFVEVHDLLTLPGQGEVFARLDREGRLPIRVLLYAPWDSIEAEAERARQYQTPRVRLAGGKMFADGTLNSRTAWMLAPYRDPHAGMPVGKPMVTPEQIDEAIARCAKLGLHLATHAIGDGAVRAVLDAYARAQSGGRGLAESELLPGVKGRIEHLELVDERDVPRFAALGVAASVQPCHLLYDIEVLERALPDRLERVLPMRELIGAGCVPGRTLLFGSDTPIVRPDPRDSVVAAVHRRRTLGVPGGAETPRPIAPTQAISEREAWDAFRA
jgi:predicted amidohydrolase YtcJ